MKEIGGVASQVLQADAATEKKSLGKDDFMKLLLTQLQHQDPLRPMDHQEFATQLAQFGQLEQLSNIGSGVKEMKAGLGEGARLQALGMIGKKIQAAGEGGAELSGVVTGVEMTGASPTLLVRTEGGEARVGLGKVTLVKLDIPEVSSK